MVVAFYSEMFIIINTIVDKFDNELNEIIHFQTILNHLMSLVTYVNTCKSYDHPD